MQNLQSRQEQMVEATNSDTDREELRAGCLQFWPSLLQFGLRHLTLSFGPESSETFSCNNTEASLTHLHISYDKNIIQAQVISIYSHQNTVTHVCT